VKKGSDPFFPKRDLTPFSFAPALFVFLWSTGFIGSRLGVPYAEPFTFLLWRFAFAALLLAGVCAVARTRLPQTAREAGHIAIAGFLVHGAYLGGVFYAIAHQVPVGLVALIVGMQPLVTATLAGPLLGERIAGVQWVGFALGFAGVALFVVGKYGLALASAPDALGWFSCVAALAGITAGTLYQKYHCEKMPLASGGAIQYAACFAVFLPLAYFTESMRVQWTGQFVFALAWLVLVLSTAAIGLLYTMIRHGEANRVASLFFLTPPVTAVMAWLLFGETLTAVALAGMALTAVGVALVSRRA
jgi:drug/metabolite transporter (DMT)-like permease